MSNRLHNRKRWLAAGALALLGILAAVLWKFSAVPPGPPPAAAASVLPPPDIRPLPPGRLALVRPDLLDALGLGETTPPAQRVDLLSGIRDKLGGDEIDLLLHELLRGRQPSTHEGWYSEYMHEICCLLGRQESAGDSFASVLAALASDTRRDDVVRDYALQHLRLLWETAAPDLRPAIVASLESIASGDSPTAASALLSLHLLGTPANSFSGRGIPPSAGRATDHAYPSDALDPVVSGFLNRPPADDATVPRMTALRVVRERRLAARIPDLRRMAGDASGEHAIVRMAAIAAIAELGTAADIAFLESLDRADPRIDAAIRHSIATTP